MRGRFTVGRRLTSLSRNAFFFGDLLVSTCYRSGQTCEEVQPFEAQVAGACGNRTHLSGCSPDQHVLKTRQTTRPDPPPFTRVFYFPVLTDCFYFRISFL
jgi:hypothetical protein